MTEDEIKKLFDIPKIRTKKQNKAMHLLFQIIADYWNDSGQDMRVVFKPDFPVQWCPYTIKNNIWRPFQIAKLAKTSTTELYTNEVGQIYKELKTELEKRKITMPPFPSIVNKLLREQGEHGEY